MMKSYKLPEKIISDDGNIIIPKQFLSSFINLFEKHIVEQCLREKPENSISYYERKIIEHQKGINVWQDPKYYKKMISYCKANAKKKQNMLLFIDKYKSAARLLKGKL